MTQHSLRTALLCSSMLVGITPALAQTATTTLPEPIEVRDQAPSVPTTETTAGPVRGYQALTTQSVTRTQTSLQETPISVQVIPRQMIDEQGAITLQDALRNAPSTKALPALSVGQLGPKVRGFAGERYIDGLPNYYDPGSRDLLVNVERIEVLKGPPSFLAQGGQTPTGGVINILSKLPEPKRFFEIGITGGSYGLITPFFDFNQPLTEDGTVLFRMTGQYEAANSNIDIVNRRSYEINPTLTFSNNRTTTLTIQGRLSHRDQQDYSGLPISGTLNNSLYTVRRTLFPSNASIPRTSSDIASLTVRLDHQFNDMWSVNSAARISSARFREPSQFVLSNNPLLPPSTFGVFNGRLNEDTSEISFNTNFIAKFDSGPAKTQVLLGVDYDRVTDKGFLNADIAGFVDFSNPVFPSYVEPASGPFTSFSNVDNNYLNVGMMLQVQSTLWERLHVLGGLRLGHVEINSNELVTGSSFKTDETRLLPRVGVAFDITPAITVFANYAQGMRPVPFFNGPSAPKPELSSQVEAGLKLNFAQGLSGTVSLFDITRNNVVAASALVPGLQVQTGQQRSQGVDADLVWQPNPNWSFLASMAWMYPRVVKDTVNEGKILDQVPRAAGRLWGTYRVTEGALTGLSVGAGLYAASPQAVNLTNTGFTPGFVTFDARIAYSWQNWTLAVVGRNLADRQYYLPYPYLDGRVAPAEGRTVFATLSARF